MFWRPGQCSGFPGSWIWGRLSDNWELCDKAFAPYGIIKWVMAKIDVTSAQSIAMIMLDGT
ncbi:MAG: hypothetical protein CMQ21_02085 [Gammaproteobacteria bacterium]|nr:hypothetical protein [Gammaproteobacteria bacterium]